MLKTEPKQEKTSLPAPVGLYPLPIVGHHRDCAGEAIYCNCHILYTKGFLKEEEDLLDEAYAMYYDPNYAG